MNILEILVTYLVPAIIGFVSAFVAIRNLPLELISKKASIALMNSETITNLLANVEKLVTDLAEANKKIAQQNSDLVKLSNERDVQQKEIALANEKIQRLEERQDVILKAQLHITLTDPPRIDSSTVEYIIAPKPVKVIPG
jgi:chromosome segregation ATPase